MTREKKKKQDASSESDTSKRGVVHASRIVAMVSAKSWVSVASSDDELLPSLRSVDF